MATKYLTLAAGGLAYALSYDEDAGLQVTGVSPDFTTITGSGFGTAGATNITFDNFDDGAVTTTAKVGTWQSVNGLTVAAEARHAGSGYAAYLNFDNTTNHGYLTGSNAILSRDWFVQYWIKLSSFDWGIGTYTSDSRFLSNIKFFRLWNPGAVSENFVSAWNFALDEEALNLVEYVEGSPSYYTGLPKTAITADTWHCLSFQWRDSSATGEADASFKAWLDGAIVEDRSGFIGRSTENLKRPFIIGLYNSWEPNTDLGETNRAPNHFYLSDAYAAPTLSRVEIGNNAVYGNCTHREVQVPTAWSDTSITVTPQFGSFAEDSSVYMFVVDADGNVSSGYGPIVIPA